MLTAVKPWLETTLMKVAEEMFKIPPALPYIVFREQVDTGGSDYQNGIATRSVSVEMYSAVIDRTSEQKIETLLNNAAIAYSKSRIWIPTESFFQTMFDFELVEKT